MKLKYPGSSSLYQHIIGAVFVFVGAIFFSSKAVIIKLAYRHEVDSITLLTLRMAFSLPFFLILAFFSGRKLKANKLSRKNWLSIFFLSTAGYYIASLFDFLGLQYVTASMERLILFVYPTLVVIFSAILFKKKITSIQYLALLLTYVGIALAFLGNVDAGSQSNFMLGAGFIFISAIAYAIYLLGSGEIIPKIGTVRFTSIAMSFACVTVITHYLLFHEVDIFELDAEIYWLSLLMAAIATVIPSFMISEGIRIIGSSNASIVGSVGPVSTIILAYLFLDEQLTFIQFVGTFLVLIGVITITIKGNKKKLAS